MGHSLARGNAGHVGSDEVPSAGFARLAMDMRVNRALIDINRGIQTGDGLRNFLRFSTGRLMKSGIVEHDEPVGQIDPAKLVGARKKFQNRTSRLMNPRIIECGEDLGRMVGAGTLCADDKSGPRVCGA